MELRCVLCETDYELDQNSKCPNCGSDKSIVISEIDPFNDQRIMRYRLWVVLIGMVIYFVGRRLYFH